MKTENQLNACNALIEILERMMVVRYECVSFPDDVSNQEPDVDFILKSTCDSMPTFAVEHTVIELFPKQKPSARWSSDIVGEINTRCRESIPSDRYYFLTLPPIFISSLNNKKKKETFVVLLASWIVEHAWQIWQMRVDEFLPYTYKAHKIILTCGGSHPSLNGNVWSRPEWPNEVKTLQRDRFYKAIQHAVKKFRKYKDGGSTTIMLLEDIAGVNHEYLTKELGVSEKDEIDRFTDYIVVLESNQDRMISGYVWKENLTWHSIIPSDRRFNFRPI